MNIFVVGLNHKTAAVDVLMAHDYSQNVSSGTDKIVLSEKVNQWKSDIEQGLDELTGLVLW